MISDTMNKSRQKTLLREYRDKLLDKRAALLEGIVNIGHDDFEALIKIYEEKLKSVDDALVAAETC